MSFQTVGAPRLPPDSIAVSRSYKYLAAFLAAIAVVTVTPGCEVVNVGVDDGSLHDAPPGFAPVPEPAHNRLTVAKVALGERLFFDPVLSGDGTVSCASCHDPEFAFSDPRPLSRGVEGRVGRRNSPGLVNVAYQSLLFWDGGSFSLENQVVAPLEDVNEMDANLGVVLSRLNADETYARQFASAFGDSATVKTLTQAIAAFQRTILGSGAPYDRYLAGSENELSESAQRGLDLFVGDAGCVSCHAGVRFTNDTFVNNGLAFANADSGRARITQDPDDSGRFRVPSLRNVALTAPFMHDGRLVTLDAVVRHYDAGGSGSRGQDERVKPLGLSTRQRQDLVAFLNSLTDEQIRFGNSNGIDQQ